MTPATYVTVNDIDTYRLGAVEGYPSTYQKIECIGDDGLVHRVVTWRNGWGMGTKVYTSGEHLHFHRNGFA